MADTRSGQTYVTISQQHQPCRREVAFSEKKQEPASSAPLHPRFADLQDRLSSFDDPQWPSKCPVRPEDLATAGFYYYGSFEGITDSVKCFQCDAGLCLWEKGDVPWTEHRRVSPNCPFVQQHHPDIVKQRKLDEQRRREEAARDPNEVVEDWMKGLMIVQCLEQNKLSRNVMKNILHQRWLQRKAPFENMDQLQEAVDAATRKLDAKFNQSRFSIRNMVRNMAISNRSKASSSGSTSESSSEGESGGSSQESVSSVPESQYSTCLSSSQSSSSQSEDEDQSSRLLCKVCLDNGLEVVFIPCGHFVCCSTCSQSLSKCPYCRKRIASAVKTYLT